MFRRCQIAALVLSSSLALIPDDVGAVGEYQCPRQPARSFLPGSETRIGEGSPPCRIEFRETGVRLKGVADGSHPDPGRTVVLDSNGRYITANAPGWVGVISLWDSTGGYLSSFGTVGQGPGEFTVRGMMNLFVDRRDNLHVMDGGFIWSVFSPEHEFLRSTSAYSITGFEVSTVMLDDGSVLTSESARDRSLYFRVVDTTGAVQRTFAPVEDEALEWGLRPIAYAGGDTFWAAPPIEGGDAYVLEEWGVDGELRRTLRREAPWYRWAGYSEISPAVSRLHVTSDGLLYVLVRRPTEAYRTEFERARRRGEFVAREAGDGLTDVLFEVIDARSGELLASDLHPATQARQFVPRALFRGSLTGYRYKESDDGLPFVEIVTLELVPR